MSVNEGIIIIRYLYQYKVAIKVNYIANNRIYASQIMENKGRIILTYLYEYRVAIKDAIS